MSEDLNLPASLSRLEINPERIDGCKMDQNRNVLGNICSETECTFQSLSLKADCPKGNCHCNRKREKELVTVKRLPFKRPIVRRSKLNPLVLRSPVLRLRENTSSATIQQAARCVSAPTPVLVKTEDSSAPHPIPISLSRLGNDEDTSSSEAPQPGSTTPLPSHSTAGSSCAVQARSSPDDTTIDELASYFDLFVHIPKKMSFMAEMMYT